MRELHLDMEQVGTLPLPRVWEIFKYFKTAPPLHLLVRDFVGYQQSDSNALPAEMESAPINRNLPDFIRKDIEEMRKAHAS